MPPDRIVHRILLIVTALLVASCYWPALDAGFLFDDFANLPSLGEYGPIDSLQALLRYLTSGIADPLGRPLAMATFLLDARDWPADPRPFLRTNLLLHVVNGLLLAAVLRRLTMRLVDDPRRAGSIALAGAALWWLHPLWVSTVGYIVQRHAMLPATFILLGVLGWLRAVEAFERNDHRAAWSWALAAVVVGTTLAALSKANGLLLPALLLVLHGTVIVRPDTGPHPARRAALLLLVLPSVLLVVGLLARIDLHPARRPWSLAERLLSEPRAIADYLGHLLFPRIHSRGVFADDFAVSTSLTSPATTLPSLLLVVALVGLAFTVRRRWPMLSAALGFYLVGHAMESSVVALELYFEHRNYLPAMLLGWPLAHALLTVRWPSRLGPGLLAIVLVLLASTTFARAGLWGDRARQAEAWGRTLPASPRAQTWAAQQELASGRADAARQRLEKALATHPTNEMLLINSIDLQCANGSASPRSLMAMRTSAAAAGVGQDVVYKWLRGLASGEVHCAGISGGDVEELLLAVESHPLRSARTISRLHRLRGYDNLRLGRCELAAERFDAATDALRRGSDIYADAALLASRCSPALGGAFLSRHRGSADTPAAPGMKRLHQIVLARQGYWNRELVRLQGLLDEDAAAAGKTDSVD